MQWVLLLLPNCRWSEWPRCESPLAEFERATQSHDEMKTFSDCSFSLYHSVFTAEKYHSPKERKLWFWVDFLEAFTLPCLSRVTPWFAKVVENGGFLLWFGWKEVFYCEAKFVLTCHRKACRFFSVGTTYLLGANALWGLWIPSKEKEWVIGNRNLWQGWKYRQNFIQTDLIDVTLKQFSLWKL